MSGPTDAELLEGIARGEPPAIAALYDRYQGLIYGMATRITGDRALAEDVLQEVFLGIWRNAATYSAERASPRTWILSIAHHRAVDFVRRRRPTSELPDTDTPPPQSLTAPEPWPDVARHLDAEAVRAALKALPEAQRQTIELAYFGGLTQQEIAARTESPLGTVKSRVRLGLGQLRSLLAEDMADTHGGARAEVPVDARTTVNRR